MASCVGEITKGIGLDCDDPIRGGYTGRALLIPLSAEPVFTKSAQNPRIITDIQIGDDVIRVDNEGVAPFEGSSTAGNNDAGYIRFTKVVSIRLPERGADFAKDVLEPIVKSGRGYILILEKTQTSGDGGFEMIGVYDPMRVVDPATVTRQETANGGAWLMNMQCSEVYAEVVWFKTSYQTTLGMFNVMWENAVTP